MGDIGAESQKNDQCSQAEGFVLVEALVLVKNKGIANKDEKKISCYMFDKYIQKNYLYNAEHLEIRRKLCLKLNHQLNYPGDKIVVLVHQIWEFNNRILEEVEYTINIQSTQQPDNLGGNNNTDFVLDLLYIILFIRLNPKTDNAIVFNILDIL